MEWGRLVVAEQVWNKWVCAGKQEFSLGHLGQILVGYLPILFRRAIPLPSLISASFLVLHSTFHYLKIILV